MIHFINGDLLEADEKFIAHQTNCCSTIAKGIAKSIFEKFPYANSYTNRINRDSMGSIRVFGDGINQRHVINMNAQFYPGPANYPDIDDPSIRKSAFHQCLIKIAKIPALNSIAFPYKLGCGLGGGDWEWYLKNIENFADFCGPSVKVSIYRRVND